MRRELDRSRAALMTAAAAVLAWSITPGLWAQATPQASDPVAAPPTAQQTPGDAPVDGDKPATPDSKDKNGKDKKDKKDKDKKDHADAGTEPVKGDVAASSVDPQKVVEVGSQKIDVKKGSIEDVNAVGNRDIGGRGMGNWYSTDSEIKMGKGYASEIRGHIDAERATPSAELRPGTPPHEGNNTTQYSVMDSDGNAVSVTYTLNGWFGIHRVAPGTGILLNNEMDDFTSKPGTANMFGLVQGEANAVAPGKTPLSSMAPTIVSKDGRTVMVIGRMTCPS